MWLCVVVMGGCGSDGIIHKVVARLCITHICTCLVLHLAAAFSVSLEL